jgi:outer membrane protein OmpA-like peptidoglycan-associated protein
MRRSAVSHARAPDGALRARVLACCSLVTLAFSLPTSASAQEIPAGGAVQNGGGGTVGTTDAKTAPPPSAQAASATPAQDAERAEKRREELMRRANTYYGPVGGIHVIEAGSGAPRSFRLQVASDFFFKNDYLYHNDQTRYVGGSLSLSVTPIEHLELSMAATSRSVRSKRPANALEPFGERTSQVQTIGNPYFDVKGYGEVAPGVTLGGDVAIQLLTKDLDDSVQYAGTTSTLRGNISLDLREMKAKVPLELRANFGYVFDQSSKVVKTLERQRLNTLVNNGITRDTVGDDEFRQLALRHERLAYNVNRVDQFIIALGLEAPLALSKRVALHPIAEWEMWVPVNRQDYDCSRAVTPNGMKIGGQDSCLGNEGADVWQQRVTLGARLFPGLAGLNLLAAVEIGLTGTTNFVRELVPTAPYRVLVAASYAVDLKPKPPVTVVKEVEKRVEVSSAPIEGRVRGVVQEQGASTPVPNAKVTFAGRELSALMADAEGRFISYAFPPGDVQIELEAEGYRPGGCSAKIAPEGGEAPVTCELVALPKVGSVSGRVLDMNGAPVPGVGVRLSGVEARSPVSDAEGRFGEQGLPPGDYQARVEHEGFLISITPVHVDLRKDTQLQITLLPKPKSPLVTIAKDKLQIKSAIFFNTDTAEIQTRSEPLLTEVADTLLRNPALLRLEIQGHTDNVGTPEHNLELSRKRAEAVRDWLVRAGVAESRLVAQGYGSEKPIAPNVTQMGRTKNRRVDFIITERGETPAP